MTDATGLRLDVTPSPALVDDALRIVVSGGRPDESVTVRARMRDGLDRRWESDAAFAADRSGGVNVAASRPVSGTYDAADPRGLLWSMRLVEGQPGGGWANASPLETEFTVTSGTGRSASFRLQRLFAGAGVSRMDVRDDGLVATLFRPAGEGPRPAIITVPGSGGGLSEGSAALLASHGFVALALAYFRAERLPESLAEIPLEYFDTAIRWLRRHEVVGKQALGVMGVSRGGELALLLGATFSEFRAVVGYVPSGVAHAGISGGGLREARRRPAWTLEGKPAQPFIASRDAGRMEEPAPSAEPLALTPVFLRALQDRAAVEAAEIPVERINGPVLMISGQDDQMWPSPVLAEIAMTRLARHHHRFPYTHLSYPGAGHIIGQPGLPATITASQHPLAERSLAYGGNAKDNAAAAADSWPKVLAFFREALT
ncbi:MAG TPA: acyl-CoA thioester hydrolase/BAAT C-terminal domain-containing protein [bacterium]|nr:acyl-CoA thioester hydrolase/BAAT C-terminal domain-containing protein [bacterium]